MGGCKWVTNMTSLYFENLKQFAFNEDGAITIDYVILLAGMVGLAIAGTTMVRTSTADVSGQVGTAAADVETTSSF